MTNILSLNRYPSQVAFQYTQERYDATPVLRLYCTQHKESWNLQVRAFCQMKAGHNPKNYIASAQVNRAELEALRNMIDEHLLEGVEFPPVPAMVDAIRKATPEILADMRDGDIARVLTIEPATPEDAEKVFKILNRAGVGAIWMGETRVFIIQSFNTSYTSRFLVEAFDTEEIKATICYE